MDPDIRAVLDFWFAPDMEDSWFERSDAFDQQIRDRFGKLYDKARRGDLESWGETPDGALALTIVLDQFPRNMFRGTPRAFESDQHARMLCRSVLARGFDKGRSANERLFLYLPLEHSESLRDQRDCLDLFKTLEDDELLDFARQHHDIIARFGCFPHRNAIIGRPNTPEEEEFRKTHEGF